MTITNPHEDVAIDVAHQVVGFEGPEMPGTVPRSAEWIEDFHARSTIAVTAGVHDDGTPFVRVAVPSTPAGVSEAVNDYFANHRQLHGFSEYLPGRSWQTRVHLAAHSAGVKLTRELRELNRRVTFERV